MMQTPAVREAEYRYMAADTADDYAAQEIMQAYGLVDMSFGRRCDLLLERAGLVDLGGEKTTWRCHGGGLGARFQQMNMKLMSSLPMASALMRNEDHEAIHRLYDDPSFAFTNMSMVGAWGRRPGFAEHVAEA
jgi:hypothetical protein